MYDATNEPNEFIADDREGAVAKAARFFEVEESDLKIVEPSFGEVMGLGARVAVVAVPLNVKKRPDSGDRGEGRGRDRDNRREGGRSRGRDRDRPRGDRGDRTPRGASEERGGRGERPDRGDRENRSERKRESGPSKAKVNGKVGPMGEFLAGLLEKVDIGSFELTEATEGNFIIYQLTGPGAAELGSGDGRARDAVQLLVNQAAMRGSDDAPRIVVDTEGSGEKREEALERLSARAAKRAKDTGRSIALDPMNGRDRRQVHMEIREIDDVVTMSIGEGRYRQVLVVPEGAPEYEDAVAASSDADDS